MRPKHQQPKDVNVLIASLNYFHPISAGVEAFLREHTEPVSIRKKKLLLKAGSICDSVYFINKGAVRGYIKDGEQDITTWITVEGELVTSISSLDIQEPSIDNMQAIEDCELLALSYARLQQLYELHPEFNIVIRKLLQRYYRDAEGRAFVCRFTKAENKYQHFLKTHSHLANRVPVKYVASFLGMAEETLSRIRRKISR